MVDDNAHLAREQCMPCLGNEPPMAIPEAKEILKWLNEGWSINSAGHLERVVLLKNFVESLALANTLGAIAEQAGHHPDLLIAYGQLRAEIWTHKISGLSRADFVLAAKFDVAIDVMVGA